MRLTDERKEELRDIYQPVTHEEMNALLDELEAANRLVATFANPDNWETSFNGCKKWVGDGDPLRMAVELTLKS